MAEERTFIAIKPDGVQRGLVGEIIKRFEQKGFKLVAMKFLTVRHYTLLLNLLCRGIRLAPTREESLWAEMTVGL